MVACQCLFVYMIRVHVVVSSFSYDVMCEGLDEIIAQVHIYKESLD